MAQQRISYVPLEKMDAAMRAEMERCEREGTPRPESSAIRAHVPACFWFFAESWNNVFRNGILDHAIKELCRLYVSRSVICEYCADRGPCSRSHQFREIDEIQRAAEGGAGLCRSDRLASQHRRRVLGADAQALQ
jgi:hypothetical protein